MKKCCFSSVCRKWSDKPLNWLTVCKTTQSHRFLLHQVHAVWMTGWEYGRPSDGGRSQGEAFAPARRADRSTCLCCLFFLPQGHFIMFSHMLNHHTKHTLSWFFHPGGQWRGPLFTRVFWTGAPSGTPSLMKGFWCWNEFHFICVATHAPWVYLKKIKTTHRVSVWVAWDVILLPPYTFYISPYFMCMHAKVTDWWMRLFSSSITQVRILFICQIPAPFCKYLPQKTCSDQFSFE